MTGLKRRFPSKSHNFCTPLKEPSPKQPEDTGAWTHRCLLYKMQSNYLGLLPLPADSLKFFLCCISQMHPLAKRSIPSTSPFSLFLPYHAIQMPVWGIQQGSTVLGLQDFLHHCQVFLGRWCLLVTTKIILLFSLFFHEQHEQAKVTSSRKHFYILCSFLPRRST